MKNGKGIPWIGIVAICAVLLLPGFTQAKSCETAIAGSGGEDTGEGIEAKHPQNDAQGQYVHTVYSRETNQPNPIGGGMVWNIRLAISMDWGQSWTYFEWVDYDVNVQQDYPDVDIYYDYPDGEWKVIVVWQERPIDGGPWGVKMRVRSGLSGGGSWNSVNTISNSQTDSIYPKTAGCSIQCCPEPPQSADSWRNVVWQTYHSQTGTYGIHCRVWSYSAGLGDITDVGIPGSQDEEYKHPAISCNTYEFGEMGHEDVHLVYEHIIPGDLDAHKIEYQGGRIPWGSNVYPSSPTFGPDVVEEGSRNTPIGYPDLWAYGPASTSGEVHFVWMDNTNVEYRRRYWDNNENVWTFSNIETVSDNGSSGSLRCVAIKVKNQQCSVAWTDGWEIYFNKLTQTQGSWDDWDDDDEEQWTDNDNTDKFVDFSISATFDPPVILYSHVVWQRDIVTVWYARDP